MKMRIILLLAVIMVLAACNSKPKTKLTDEDKVEIKDFIGFFRELQLPLQVADTSLGHFNKDSASIGYKIFTKFIPDTVINKDFPGKAKPALYAIGKNRVKDGETYVFIKAITTAKKVAYIAVFDHSNKFTTAMQVAYDDKDANTYSSATMDKRYTLTRLSQQIRPGKEMLYKKDVYIYNTAGSFNLILTEGNDEKVMASQSIINPIDTMPAKNKLSGDYILDKRNFISIRDGRKPTEVLFFVHFEKDNGSCRGELKGEARVISEKKIVFTDDKSPCALEFNIAGKTLSLNEANGCGAYRDIKCFFEGSFTKKVIPVKKVKSKK